MLNVFQFAALWLPYIAFLEEVNPYEVEFSTLADVRSEITTECDNFLRLFANTTKEFDLCAVKHAKPLRFCEKCTKEYTDLLARNPVKYHDSNCIKDLVKSERFQIVMKVYDFQTGLWQSAHCDRCYKARDEANSTWEQTKYTKKFFHHFKSVLDCFGNCSNGTYTNRSQLCETCKHYFNKMKNVYKKILDNAKNKDEDELCVDIMSAMNDTRNDWKRFDCWGKKETRFFVLSLSCLLCFCTFIFYVGVRKHEKYKHKVQSRSHRVKKEVNYDSE